MAGSPPQCYHVPTHATLYHSGSVHASWQFGVCQRVIAASPVRAEIVDEGLVGDIELSGAAPTMDDPFVAHNRSAGVYPEGWQLPLGIHPPPPQSCQIKLPHLHPRQSNCFPTCILLGCRVRQRLQECFPKSVRECWQHCTGLCRPSAGEWIALVP